MEHGVITHFPPTSNHGFAITERGEKVFLHRTEACTIRSDGDRLAFAEPTVGRLPQRGDKIVFERTHNEQGIRAQPWGFHEEYRSANSKLFTPLLMMVSLKEHPYLLDVLEKASRFKHEATYRFQNRRLTISLLQKCGYDDVIRNKQVYYYAVDLRGPTCVHELKSEFIGSSNSRATNWVADPIITQLFKLGIPALDQGFRLVRVSIHQEPFTERDIRNAAVNSDVAPDKRLPKIIQRWMITVYRDQA